MYQTINSIRLNWLGDTFASEVPADADATKPQYTYAFGTDKVTTGSSDVTLVNSYSKIKSDLTDYWKFANYSGMTNGDFNSANGLHIQAATSEANQVMALYIPRAGKYKFEYKYVGRTASGTLDMYFAKCPDNFVAGSSATLPFAPSDRIADDVSFYLANATITDYTALDNVVEVPRAGTYLIGFTDFKQIGGTIGATNQAIHTIRLTDFSATFAGEVPASVDATKPEYEYLFGNDKVNGASTVSEVTSYSKVTQGDPWKFANASGMTSTGFNSTNGFSMITPETPASTANVVLALYVPRAGEYSVSFMTVDRNESGKLDVYFGKCPDSFSAGASTTLPLGSSRIAEGLSFYSNPTKAYDEYNKSLDGTVVVSEPGTYLIAFTGFEKEDNVTYSGRLWQQ